VILTGIPPSSYSYFAPPPVVLDLGRTSGRAFVYHMSIETWFVFWLSYLPPPYSGLPPPMRYQSWASYGMSDRACCFYRSIKSWLRGLTLYPPFPILILHPLPPPPRYQSWVSGTTSGRAAWRRPTARYTACPATRRRCNRFIYVYKDIDIKI